MFFFKSVKVNKNASIETLDNTLVYIFTTILNQQF